MSTCISSRLRDADLSFCMMVDECRSNVSDLSSGIVAAGSISSVPDGDIVHPTSRLLRGNIRGDATAYYTNLSQNGCMRMMEKTLPQNSSTYSLTCY